MAWYNISYWFHTTKEQRKRSEEFQNKVNNAIDEALGGKKNPTDNEMTDAIMNVIDKIQNKEIEY